MWRGWGGGWPARLRGPGTAEPGRRRGAPGGPGPPPPRAPRAAGAPPPGPGPPAPGALGGRRPPRGGALDRRDRAVRGVVLAASGVGVQPRDERRGAHLDAHVAERDRAAVRALRDAGARPQAAEPCAAPVELQRAVGEPGRGERADAHAPERDVEPRARRALEPDTVQPDPALGVLRAPVVADHAGPGVELPALAVGLDPARDRGVGQRALRLRARQRRVIETRVGEGAQRRGGGGRTTAPIRAGAR